MTALRPIENEKRYPARQVLNVSFMVEVPEGATGRDIQEWIEAEFMKGYLSGENLLVNSHASVFRNVIVVADTGLNVQRDGLLPEGIE